MDLGSGKFPRNYSCVTLLGRKVIPSNPNIFIFKSYSSNRPRPSKSCRITFVELLPSTKQLVDCSIVLQQVPSSNLQHSVEQVLNVTQRNRIN